MTRSGSESNGHGPDRLAVAVDHGGRAPLGGHEEYEQLVAGMVDEFAPLMFAVIQDYGDRVDSRIAAWGLAFDDRCEIVGVDRGLWMSTTSPERSLVGFTHRPDITARVLWVHLGPEAGPVHPRGGPRTGSAGQA